MNMVHLQLKEMPKDMELETLMQLLVIADCYGMESVVLLVAQGWVNRIIAGGVSIPNYYGPASTYWMLLATRLDKTDVFTEIVHLAVDESRGPIQDLGSPFRGVIDKLEKRRSEALDTLVQGICKLLRRLEQDRPDCSEMCSTLLLGTLRRRLAEEFAEILQYHASVVTLDFRSVRNLMLNMSMPRTNCISSVQAAFCCSIKGHLHWLVKSTDHCNRYTANDILLNEPQSPAESDFLDFYF